MTVPVTNTQSQIKLTQVYRSRMHERRRLNASLTLPTPKSCPFNSWGDRFVSIIRIGLAETKNFAEGYDAIFGKKKETETKKTTTAKIGGAKKKKKAKKS